MGRRRKVGGLGSDPFNLETVQMRNVQRTESTKDGGFLMYVLSKTSSGCSGRRRRRRENFISSWRDGRRKCTRTSERKGREGRGERESSGEGHRKEREGVERKWRHLDAISQLG